MNIDIERLKHDREYWDEWEVPFDADGATKNGWVKKCDQEDSWFWMPFKWDDDFSSYQWHRTRTRFDIDPWGEFIPRPAKQWCGDGLPPVGTKGATSGGQCEVLAVNERRGSIAIQWYDGELGVVPLGSFRPLKSEKDRVVEAMMNLLGWQYADKDALGILYDAGALKMPEDN